VDKHSPTDPRTLNIRRLALQQMDLPEHTCVGDMSSADVLKLIHELETHQIELEMQNEALRLSQVELEESRDRYSDLYDLSPVGYATLTSKGLILEANLYLAEMLGLNRSQVIGKRLSHYVHYDSQDTYHLFMSQMDEAQAQQACEVRLATSAQSGTNAEYSETHNEAERWVRIDSRVRFGKNAEYFQIHLSISNISEQHRDRELLKHRAHYDQLTTLPNRELFVERLEQELAHLKRNNCSGALFFIDIDDFKLINDSLGHSVGDQVLKHVAHVLNGSIRQEDTCARFGGDEFVVLLRDLNRDKEIAASEALSIANKIKESLGKSYYIGGLDFRVEVSVGIVLIPEGKESVDEVMSHADITMYKAKKSGKNGIEFYDNDMQPHVKRLLELQQDLRRALDENEYSIHYQPQTDEHNHVIGAECLLRWSHPSKGNVTPGEFIPVLEQSGSMMIPVGKWVLASACEKLVLWQNMGAPFSRLTLAVNVSPKQFNSSEFVQHVIGVLKETGANPEQLVLEITENMLLINIESVIEKMNQLKDIGVTFSLDDFGTGYSSLSYLKRLPIDTLKIDQSFVRNVDRDKDNSMLVETMLTMASHLELKVIAEGVETEAEKTVLIEKGCYCFQGFLFSKPLIDSDFESVVRNSIEN